VQVFPAIFLQKKGKRTAGSPVLPVYSGGVHWVNASLPYLRCAFLQQWHPKRISFADILKMDVDFDFILQSAGGQEHYRVSGEEGTVDGFVIAFLPLFEDCDPVTGTVQALQRNTMALQGRFEPFIKVYGEKWPPLNGITAFLRKLGQDEPFLFLPVNGLTQSHRLILHNYIKSVKEGKDFETLYNESKDLFGTLIEKYQLHAYETIVPLMRKQKIIRKSVWLIGSK